MPIPFKGYLDTVALALDNNHGVSRVAYHMWHSLPRTQNWLMSGCGLRKRAGNVVPGIPPRRDYRCPCCDFGTADRPPALPKALRTTAK
jgi:hypothetical protein